MRTLRRITKAFREDGDHNMKHHDRTFAGAAALLAAIAAMSFAGCGGKQTMASKSAAAYDEAKKKGIPIAAGEHGGHSNAAAQPAATPAAETDHDAMTGMDHSAMTGMDHSAMSGMAQSKMPRMQHGSSATSPHAMAGMDRAAMPGTAHASMPGMQHDGSMAAMPGMRHGSAATSPHAMAGMDHAAMPGMAHASMPGVQHDGSMAAMPGMQHGSTSTPAMVIASPATNAAIAQTQPAATLRADEFDAPAPAAIDEAAKAASGMVHSMDGAAPPQQQKPSPQQKPPQSSSPHHHHGNGEAS